MIVGFHMVVADSRKEDCMIRLTNSWFTHVDNVVCLQYLIMRKSFIIVEFAEFVRPLLD